MHVLFTIANNGSVPYFDWFAERAAREGPRFSFVALHHERPRMLDEMRARGLDAFWVRFDPERRRSGLLLALPRLLDLLRCVRPDVLHAHLFDDSLPALLAARLARVRARVVTKQDVGFHWRYSPRHVFFDRLNNANATHVHAVSERTRRFIVEKEGAPEAKVHLIRNGFPPGVVTAARPATVARLREAHGLGDRFVVGTVARLIEWKGHRHVLQAARRLVAEYPQLLFVWAGTGALRARLADEILAAGLGAHVRFLDWVEREDMPSLYRCLDVYLHPAEGEPFGFAIAEAAMNGVPVAATPCGATEVLAPGREFQLLREGSSQDVEAALRHYLADPERRRATGERGRAVALEALSFERMWRGHLELYRGALEDR